jgi:poly-gamma-glutamate capsule biosynthesis protein CapA/YwtB (metallophosphatase superfamily)
MKIFHRLIGCLITVALLAAPVGLNPTPRALRLALLGDVMLGRWVGQALCHNGQAACDWPAALSTLAPILSSADLALANLESPLTTAPMTRENYDLRASPKSAQALSAAGLDLISLANNHIMDSGAAGLDETRAALQAWKLQAVDPNMDPVWRTVGNLRIAFLAFQDIRPRIDLTAAADEVRRARMGGYLVVVSVHWGYEYQAGQNARQKEIAQTLADAGAVLVWGHHPHVLQPVVWLQGAGQPFRTLVAYSLGNALFDQMMLPDTQQSAVLLVTINQNGVQEVQAVPFEIDALRGRVKDASPKAAEVIFQRLQIP